MAVFLKGLDSNYKDIGGYTMSWEESCSTSVSYPCGKGVVPQKHYNEEGE